MKHGIYLIITVIFLVSCDGDKIPCPCPDNTICGDNGQCVNKCLVADCEEGCDFETGECVPWMDENTQAKCADSQDNDGDGFRDCDDPDCAAFCQLSELCYDGTDNDGDGSVDCDDPDCALSDHCFPTETICTNGIDDDEDGDVDCDDDDCAEDIYCQPGGEMGDEQCSDGVDNDEDGSIDCADPGCQGSSDLCGSEDTHDRCADGIDNDGDGLTDCYDDECTGFTDICSVQPNDGWIGGICSDSTDCDYADSTCLTDSDFGGMCSLACTQYCPDSEDTNNSITFCIENPLSSGEGICVARCDTALFPGSGCREGYSCVSESRFNSTVVQSVCLPESLAPTQCSETDYPQPNAGIVSPAGIDGCPSGMAPIGTTNVCMDLWEAHLVEVTASGDIPFSPYHNPGTVSVKAVSAPGAVPQGYINQVQATSACAAAGKRLCSLSEWLSACQGSNNYIYPYGNTRISGACNDARSPHPVVEYFGTSDSWIWSELGHPCINQLHDSLDLTGTNVQCVSSWGHFDLMGNLHEWIDDPAGTFKGGYYVDTAINGEGCLYTTTAHNVSHWDYSTGFRCCATK
ncbi:hypothetical protein KKF34_00795 [Myxococcota bacterium]|nr:hypothetical protein [Myxococcota bacterium]MBU1382671.1 hypothetical protein [Myxococcota bacterium]MBU1495399.1 hypothetical protein [Myxococcota bacterium]